MLHCLIAIYGVFSKLNAYFTPAFTVPSSYIKIWNNTVNSLWPPDATWQHRSGSVMVWQDQAITWTSAEFSQGSHALWKTQGNGLSMENQGNLREFANLHREFEKTKISGNSQGILAFADLSIAFEKCHIVFICFALSCQTSIMYGSIY